MSRKREFFQDGPRLGNQYDDDAMLRDYVLRALPHDVREHVEAGFRLLGERAVSDVWELGKVVDASPPSHVPFDAWGRRVDRIEVSRAWEELGRIAAAEGLISEAYARTYGAYSRVVQFIRAYLFGASSVLYTCPLAMTDGAARVLELYGSDALMQGAFKKLTSSDPSSFWTSGQWMTEREGGSDVGRTATIALPSGDIYRLYGTKYFTSSINSPMAMTLARIKGAPSGNRGLSMFYLETHDAAGNWNKITVNRLKDKLGTKGVPTAEVTMGGTRAVLVGKAGEGVREITAMLNVTRVWNACEATGLMRRSVALVRDYARRRETFGKPLAEHPAFVDVLAEMETELRAGFALTFFVVELLGKAETGNATTEELALMRLLTPVAKLFTAKQAVRVASEALECFGGMGYVEDTGLPRLLRDAQVLPTWEGATNVLALDVLQVLAKTDALEHLSTYVDARLAEVRSENLAQSVSSIQNALRGLRLVVRSLEEKSSESREQLARPIAFGVARVTIAVLLAVESEWAQKSQKASPALARLALDRWLRTPLLVFHGAPLAESQLLSIGK